MFRAATKQRSIHCLVTMQITGTRSHPQFRESSRTRAPKNNARTLWLLDYRSVEQRFFGKRVSSLPCMYKLAILRLYVCLSQSKPHIKRLTMSHCNTAFVGRIKWSPKNETETHDGCESPHPLDSEFALLLPRLSHPAQSFFTPCNYLIWSNLVVPFHIV